ncbi:hypothetical protein Pyn_36099 [Prunus yedoensis var. nudiflora]|uniref:Pentatricopeptide repeat-containing protein n=1 Tax=Prunus yedoensis var. nudiflora TaxID=2094558 RepID=A0A314U7F0_PRUYE|nr:hypothetical protein Pyn_36099 [Prunus yedoensis var. nudiflora]
MLSACTRLLDFRAGESIHYYNVVNYIGIDVALGTALLEMYLSVVTLRKPSKFVFQSWTIMISGLADHGHGKDAISLFTRMEQTRLVPDSMPFAVNLSACSHLGHVHKGRQFSIKCENIWYSANIRTLWMLSRFAWKSWSDEEAYEINKNMPMEPNSVILRSFLGACRNHGLVISLDDKLRKLLIS